MDNREKTITALQAIVTGLSQQADGHAIQSRIFAGQGFTKLANKYAEHATEERGYVDKCIDRILDLGGEVKNEAKKESPICQDAVEWIKCDLLASREGLAALAPLVEMVQRDPATFDILVAYYKDEEEDLLWGEQQLALIEAVGRQNWLVQQL